MRPTGENRSTRGKVCPSATLPTTNLTWTDPGSNPGLRGERPATNRLSHGTTVHTLTHLRTCLDLQIKFLRFPLSITLTYYMKAYMLLCVYFLLSFFSFIYYSGIDEDTFNYSLGH
jgi:hypothetical protein